MAFEWSLPSDYTGHEMLVSACTLALTTLSSDGISCKGCSTGMYSDVIGALICDQVGNGENPMAGGVFCDI